MVISTSEFAGLLLRAGRGAGMPLGLAEELSAAAAQLGTVSGEALLEAFEGPFGARIASAEGLDITGDEASATVSAIDLALAGEGPVRLGQTGEIARALVRAASVQTGRDIRLDDGVLGLGAAGTAGAAEPEGEGERVTIAASVHAALKDLAARNLVPESLESRSAGAGAGSEEPD